MAKKPSFYYPAKLYKLNQEWGRLDPKTYSQFGFTRHNGVDIAPGADKMLYAPFDYTIVRTGNQPAGGGIFLGMMSEEFLFPDGKKARVLLDMLHCEALYCHEGQTGKAGDLLGKADNTGFSTGPHTHLQPRRVKRWNGKWGALLSWTQVDRNDANGSFDPTPYWNGLYAKDLRAAYAFTRDLKLGSRGTDVMELQKFLNRSGFPLARIGQPGSTGYETSYFGTATRDALISFQRTHGIQPSAGYFGTITRAYIANL